MPLTQKEEYAKMVCLFLAEGLRTRRITLQNAAEIAGKFLQNINLLDNEYDFLRLIKELSKDFEELSLLERKADREFALNATRTLEGKVRDYVVQIIVNDTKTALALLQDAGESGVTPEDLYSKYPQFKEFMQRT